MRRVQLVMGAIGLSALLAWGLWTMSTASRAAPGAQPTAAPGLIGQTPDPRPTPKAMPPGALSVSDAAAAAAASRIIAAQGTVNGGSLHVQIEPYGSLSSLQDIPASYTADYPIIVATADGMFTPTFGPPPGLKRRYYAHVTYYADGVTANEIALVLDSPLEPGQ